MQVTLPSIADWHYPLNAAPPEGEAFGLCSGLLYMRTGAAAHICSLA